MKKRIQAILSDEAWSAIESLTKEANDNFDAGSISYSDVINEMAVSSRIDIKVLQLKHTSLKKSLRILSARKDVDLDSAIKSLMELKARSSRKNKSNNEEVHS